MKAEVAYPGPVTRSRRVTIALFVVYLAGLVRVTLWPRLADDDGFDLVRTVLGWINAAGIPLTYSATEFLANIALFVPFGILVASSGPGCPPGRSSHWAWRPPPPSSSPSCCSSPTGCPTCATSSPTRSGPPSGWRCCSSPTDRRAPRSPHRPARTCLLMVCVAGKNRGQDCAAAGDDGERVVAGGESSPALEGDEETVRRHCALGRQGGAGWGPPRRPEDPSPSCGRCRE